MSNRKGEVATILTISSLVFLGVVSLVSSFFIKKTDKIQSRASSCSQVSSVSYSPSSISAGQTFTCTLSGSIVNQYTMACGWSKNGGWPQGMQSGSCSGSTCTFTLKMEDNVDPNSTYELVGFDYRSDCGPNTGKRVSLTINGVNPQPTQPNCQGDCCGKPNGYKVKPNVRMDCDSSRGRYVIIDKVCQNNQEVDQPSCVSCRSCGAGDPPISPVSAVDLAVNECTGGCQQNQGNCQNLVQCPNNITPAVFRSCADLSFSCPIGYASCKKDGAIWCYGGGASGGQRRVVTPVTSDTPISISPSIFSSPTPEPGTEGGECLAGFNQSFYYCSEPELECSNRKHGGICVKRSPTPESGPTSSLASPTLTSQSGPTSQPTSSSPTPRPESTPSPSPSPTPPLLSETGVWANPGQLIIENVGNDELRIQAISLQGSFLFSEYIYISKNLSSREIYTFNFGQYCNFYRRKLTGHLAYYSSKDNYSFTIFKSLDLSCNLYYVIPIE